jgi:hypothetical protein
LEFVVVMVKSPFPYGFTDAQDTKSKEPREKSKWEKGGES